MAVAQVHDPDTVRRATEAELSSWQYQTELPRRQPDSWPDGFDLPDIPHSLLEVIFWLVVAVAAIVFVVWLVRFIAERRFDSQSAEPVVAKPARTRHASPTDLLDQADRLAAQGRYGEAVHVLLIGVLGGFAETGAGFVAPPLTSREVVANAPLRDRVKAALGELVTIVERAHFAGRAIGQGEFSRARASFTSIADEIVSGTPA